MRFAILPHLSLSWRYRPIQRDALYGISKEGREVKAFNFKRLYPDILFPGKTQYVEAGDRAIEIESVRVR